MDCGGYGFFGIERACGCEVTYLPGILDFYLDKINGAPPNEYFTRFAGSVSYTDDPNEGQDDGSGYTKWGMKYRDNLRVFCEAPNGRTAAAWNGTRVLRREFFTLPDFSDLFDTTAGALASHVPNSHPHTDQWTEAEGSWTSGSTALTLTSTGNGRATTDYRFPNATTTGYVLNSSTDVEAGILARGNGGLTGSIRLHWSKAANEAELSIYNTSMEVIDFTTEAPAYVMLQINAADSTVSASARGFNSSGVATGPLKTTANYTDAGYDFEDSPTIYGVYGEKDTGQDCIFDRFGSTDPVFLIQFAGHERVTLYQVGKTSSSIHVLGSHVIGGTLCTPNAIIPGSAPTFAADGTRTYYFFEDNGTLTTRNVVGNDHSGGNTDRALGITAGLWDPSPRDFGYGLGIKISGTEWRLVGGNIVFGGTDDMPIVNEADEIDTYDWGTTPPIISPVGGISGQASVNYQSMEDGSVVAGGWSHTSGIPTFNHRFIRCGGTTHIITDTAKPTVIAPGCAALIATVSGDGVFRIYNSSGVIYSDTHATRWSNAQIICANDRWFYVADVSDWSGYTTEEPSSVHGSPPTYINLLISLDGSERVRICQYDELNSRYDNPTTPAFPTTGGFGSAGLRPTIDSVKRSTLDYTLPATISYPAP